MPAFPSHPTDDIAASLSVIDSSSPVTEVTRRLLDLFTRGDIATGTRLPPERQLASSLGVGRSAVREALAALEVLGIVTVRPGSGTYLRGTASDLLPSTLSWGLLLGPQSTAELLELRAGLEIFVARLAAGSHDQQRLDELDRALQHMRDAAPHDLAAFAAADRDFHDQLGYCTGNRLLVDQLQVVRSLLHIYDGRVLHDHRDAITALSEHEAIFRAVSGRDADVAASAMATHMATASTRISDHGGKAM